MNGDDISWLVSMQRDAILSIHCNNGCNMSSVNIFTLNGCIFHVLFNILLQ